MFQDALFVPEKKAGSRAGLAALAALAHGFLALLLVVIPLMRTGDLPKVELTGVFLAPPPPVPLPPPPKARAGASRAAGRIKPVARRAAFETGLLTAPIDIPRTISNEPLDWGASGNGVEGGVDYGAADGLPKDLIAQGLYNVIGEETAPVRSAGEARMPRLVKRVEPDYPEIARQAHIQGIVVLEATTDLYGRVVNVRVLRSVPLLDAAAVDAVRQWAYEPLVINGRPRSVVFTVTLRFELK
jgi:protein TonB